MIKNFVYFQTYYYVLEICSFDVLKPTLTDGSPQWWLKLRDKDLTPDQVSVSMQGVKPPEKEAQEEGAPAVVPLLALPSSYGVKRDMILGDAPKPAAKRANIYNTFG